MSGPAIHHIVADQVIRKIQPQLDPIFASEILNGRFNPYLNLGCQGPDWLFFLTKDWGPNIDNLAKTYLEIDHFIEKLKKDILAIIPPELIKAVDDLKQAANDVAKRSSAVSVIRDCLQRGKDTMSLLNADLIKFVEKYITDGYNIFTLLNTTAYHDVENLKDWWWFDTLHYRKTGEFTKALLKNAKNDFGSQSGAYAFALGYATHYATDTVGHPFVNTMVGGPYRTHSQRHKFVENHHDVWAWKNLRNDEEFIKSKIGENFYKLEGNEDFLPKEVKEVILKSLRELYFDAVNGTWLYGKEITDSDLDNAYQLWLGYFKRATSVTELPEPMPYSFTEDAEAIFKRFLSNVSDLGNAVGNPAGGNASLLSILEAIALAVLSPFLIVAAAIDFLLGEVENIAAAPINYLLSFIYENLYTSFKQLHYGLALNGLAFPFKEQLDSDISIHTTDSSIEDKNGNTAKGLIPNYPMKKFSVPGMENSSHLIYPFISPGNSVEIDITTVAPDSYFNKTPEFYISGQLKHDPDYFQYVSNFHPNKNIFERKVDFQNFKNEAQVKSLGNAIDYSVILINDFLNNGEKANFPNFNLDSDRGYAFKGWRRVQNPTLLEVPTGIGSNHDLVDIPDVGIKYVAIFSRTEDKNVECEVTDILNIQPNSKVL
jgi:Zinc dependent phospholipase C